MTPRQGAAQSTGPSGSSFPVSATAQPLFPAASAPFQISTSAARGIGAVGGFLAAAGVGVSIYGYLGFLFSAGPIAGESRSHLRTCCMEQAFLAPGFLALAGGGLMLGYGVDYARQSSWDLVFESRMGFIVTGSLLGATAALYITSAALHAASFSEVSRLSGRTYSLSESGERMVAASAITMGASLFFAFPAGVSTGVYLSRYLRERSPSRRSSAWIPRPVDVVLTPMLSRETYGLYAAGRF